jgi:hypothetical protein
VGPHFNDADDETQVGNTMLCKRLWDAIVDVFFTFFLIPDSGSKMTARRLERRDVRMETDVILRILLMNSGICCRSSDLDRLGIGIRGRVVVVVVVVVVVGGMEMIVMDVRRRVGGGVGIGRGQGRGRGRSRGVGVAIVVEKGRGRISRGRRCRRGRVSPKFH